jgi:hypothetical protein
VSCPDLFRASTSFAIRKFIIFVDEIFTTSLQRLFTNVFDVSGVL